MTNMLLQQKLEATLNEGHTHLKRMAYAYKKAMSFLPVTAITVATLTNEQTETLDHYIYRFTKLQDAMGQRLFKQVLQWLAEDTTELAFIDILNRLEKLGLLPSATEWLELRQLRNLLAHEYADSHEQLAEGINTAFEKFNEISAIFNQFATYIHQRLQSKTAPEH